MTEAERIAEGLTEAQRKTLVSSKPLVDARILVPAYINRRKWPTGVVGPYSVAFRRLTDLGLAVRQVLEAEKEQG